MRLSTVSANIEEGIHNLKIGFANGEESPQISSKELNSSIKLRDEQYPLRMA